jgi:hypothetical protein
MSLDVEKDGKGFLQVGHKGRRAPIISKTCLIFPLALIIVCVVDRISGFAGAHSMRHASAFSNVAKLGKWPMCRAPMWI